MIRIPFDNQFARLGEPFYSRVDPTPVEGPALIQFNRPLAAELGVRVDGASDDDLAHAFSGNRVPDGADPLAMAYAGHQFGHFVPQLGDGRAIWLGELSTERGARYDIQLKGSGPTAYSRRGDGRSALGPVLREYLLSEAMHRLGVPTTRALAAVTTGEEVARESLRPGGVITRVATSFIRVGTFEFFAARRDAGAIRKLADYVIARNYPALVDTENRYVDFLTQVISRQATLIAQWMSLGFIHGVMNTDNMSVAGETIDYGPCAFMDGYRHDRVFSSIDHGGRYAYHNQPGIGLWNLIRLAEALIPLLAPSTEAAVAIAEERLNAFQGQYEAEWLRCLRAKLGLIGNADDNGDRALIAALFDTMNDNEADFTLVFHWLSRIGADTPAAEASFRNLFAKPDAISTWLRDWRGRLAQDGLPERDRQANIQSVNPVYIPRNHQVEAAIRAAEDHNDFSVFHALHAVLNEPFTEKRGQERYALPPEPEQAVTKTFCGT